MVTSSDLSGLFEDDNVVVLGRLTEDSMYELDANGYKYPTSKGNTAQTILAHCRLGHPSDDAL
jgi:hypothetical protein